MEPLHEWGLTLLQHTRIDLRVISQFNRFGLRWCPELVGEGLKVVSLSSYRAYGSLATLDCHVGYKKYFDAGTSEEFAAQDFLLFCGTRADGSGGQWQDPGSKVAKAMLSCKKIPNWCRNPALLLEDEEQKRNDSISSGLLDEDPNFLDPIRRFVNAQFVTMDWRLEIGSRITIDCRGGGELVR